MGGQREGGGGEEGVGRRGICVTGFREMDAPGSVYA